MEPRDAEDLFEIETLCFNAPWNIGTMMEQMAEGIAVYCCLVIDEKVIGYTGFNYVMTESDILSVAINPSFQGNGYGKILMRNTLDYQKSLGIDRVFLEVRVSNERAIRLYKGMGFEELTIRKKYYEDGEDAYVMSISI